MAILNLTRDQLSSFLNNHEQIKQFERLFEVASAVSGDPDTLAIGLQAAGADQKSNQALALLEKISESLALIASSPANERNNSIKADYIDLLTAPSVPQAGRMAWDAQDKTASIGMDYGVVLQVGQETYARVKNATGATISNGSVVGFAGAASDSLLVSKYLADGSASSLYILGVMTHDLPDSGEKGYCTVWGFVRGLNTSAFSVGDILYASTSVAGGMTNVKPTAPNNVIPLAACIVSDATNGVIFVRPTIQQMQYYGVFTKTTDQTPAAINTEYRVTFDNTQISNGVTIGSPTSRIVVPQSGMYRIDATVQITSSSSSAKNIWVWFKKNGSAIANSSRIVTSDINGGYVPLALIEPVSLTSNDYIELAFASDSTSVTIDNVPATAFAPASPSVILSITQVQQ